MLKMKEVNTMKTYQTTDQVEQQYLGHPAPGNPAAPPTRKLHGWWWLLWAFGGIIVVAIIAAAASLSGGTATQQAPAPAPAATAPANPAPATPTLAERFSTWVTSGGIDQLTAVGTDLGNISADASAQDTAALASDGQQLAADAQTALDNPPPGWLEHNYSRAMTELVAAGGDLQNSNYAGATGHINTATTYINKSTRDINSLGAGVTL